MKINQKQHITKRGVVKKNPNRLPSHIRNKDIQFEGMVSGKKVKVFYDDLATKSSTGNEYAVFTEDGFIGWLQIGWTMYELIELIKKYKPTTYQKALKEFREMMGK